MTIERLREIERTYQHDGSLQAIVIRELVAELLNASKCPKCQTVNAVHRVPGPSGTMKVCDFCDYQTFIPWGGAE